MSKILSMSEFFLSFSPLWVSVIFIDCKNIFIDRNQNIVTEIAFILFVLTFWFISLGVLCFFLNSSRKDNTTKYTIKEVKENKTITSDYLLAYILPLFTFDFTMWDGVIEFLIFFIVFAYLCIKHNHFSVNIILEIMGYSMYECTLVNSDNKEIERIIISREKLTAFKGYEVQTKPINNDFLKMVE